jgi:hypothetical protein
MLRCRARDILRMPVRERGLLARQPFTAPMVKPAIEALDGKDSLSFARLGGAVFVNGNPANVGYTSEQTSTGVYRVNFPAGTFKTANSCKTPTPIVVAHSDTAVIATVAIGMATCSAVDGTGGFTARTFTPAGAATSSAFWFMVL